MAPKPLQRVVWSEGMLVSQHHVQQQDLYHEALLDERIASLTPYGWGVVSAAFDQPALQAGQVLLRSFAGVTPFGAVLRWDHGEPEAPPARSVSGHFAPNQSSLDVYLGLARERIGTRLYAESESTRGQARYVREIREVTDAVDPSLEASVEFARRNLVLLFGTEPREDFECIKVAEVIRDADGRFAYSEPFVPPLLRIAGSSFVMGSVSRLLALIVSRQRALAEERRHRDASSVEYGPHDVTRFLALSALSGAIPVLTHASESGQLSAHQLYLCLAQLAGQLMAFAVDGDPSSLPGYVHEEPRNTFEPLFARITSLLRAAVSSRVLTVRLDPREDGMHLAKLTHEQLFKPGVRFLLDVRSQTPEAQSLELVPRVAKVASWSEIARFVNAATLGAPVTAVPKPPREVAVRHGHCYFGLPPDHAVFRKVLEERTIAVHLPPPFDPKSTVLELVAIPSE